ncbi:MAG: EpsG family protein, partial [Chitinophagales bacterium]|nr:EpsG family protein [Chitinophagales bacterium]
MHYTFSQYYIYVIFVAVMAAFSYLNKLNRTEVFSFFMYAIMLLFAVLRIDTGADYSTYIEMHEEAGKSYFTDLFSFTEPLYFLLLKVLYLFSDDYWLMFAVVAIIIYTILFLVVKKLSIDPALSLLLYILVAYYFISINQLRQSISLVIFLYSISSI